MATHITGTTHCRTTRFGGIDVDNDLIITFSHGLIGFEACKRFTVIQHDDKSPFKWFQSLDDGALAFPIIDPWQFKPDYAPRICDADAVQLELAEETPKLLFAIVTIPRGNPRAMTANLLGPLVINPLTRRGKQAIVTNEDYTTKHSIMEELRSAKG